MKLYENLAEGVVMLFPSSEFFQELIEKRIHAFGPWEMLRRMGADWHQYMDYYVPEISPYVYYFNSWKELHEMLQKPVDKLDSKNVRETAPKAYKKIVDQMLNGWAELFEEMGFNVLVDGQPRTKETGILKFKVPTKYAQPKDVEQWRHTYERIKAWKSFEREEQNKIWDRNEKALDGIEKKIKEYAKSGNVLEMMKREALFAADQLQYQVLDYLNGELGQKSEAVFGGSLVGVATFDVVTTIKELIQKYEAAPLKEYKHCDYFVFGFYSRFLRIFHTLSTQPIPDLASFQTTEMKAKLNQFNSELSKILYPWLLSKKHHETLGEVSASFKTQRGIVFTFPTSGFNRGVHLILTIRNILKCNLPIEIFYNGDQDLVKAKRDILAKLPGSITFVNLQERLPNVKDMFGYSIKPFVILASSFREVIFLDDDVTLLQNPDTFLAESKLWKDYGSIFFLDRSFSRGNSEWVRSFLTMPSLVAQKSR
ncbi:hypothetical protein HDU99_005640, partial [Rhizoclosmatium hyalinum]